MENKIQKDIKEIVAAAKDNLFYFNTSEDNLDSWQKYPVVIALSEISGLVRGDNEELEFKNRDVTMSIIGQYPDRTTKDTDITYEEKIITIQDEYCDILEQMIKYLTNTNYKFCYSLESDISFEHLKDQTVHVLQGVQAVFTVSKRYSKGECCVDFNENILK